jgi:hypothetical protein
LDYSSLEQPTFRTSKYWNKPQLASQNTLSTLANATTQIPGFKSSDHTTVLSNLGIPLTGSMATGFAVGFMKG